MGNKVDLHIHTKFSDGSYTSEEIIQQAKEIGLKAIAITDHDTVEGIPSALKYAMENDFEVIPGIEFGADFNPEMHILGYFPYGGYEAFKNLLEDMREQRVTRNARMIEKLNKLGYKITNEEVDEVKGGGVCSRLHIAIAMKNKGYVKEIKEAFEKFIGPKGAAYIKKDKLSPKEVIQLIDKNKGVAVIAHPIHLNQSIEKFEEMIKEYIKAGLKGIEVYYPSHNEAYIKQLEKLCKKHDLIATSGSDFHGENTPLISLGTDKEYDIVERIKNN